MRSVTRVSTGIVVAAAAAAALSLGTARAGQGPAPPQASSPVPAGQTLTRLPDGRWLVVGGEVDGRPVAGARLVDPRDAGGSGTPLPVAQARAWHSATVLPDGTVLIAGGIGADGLPAASEIFDPASATFRSVTVDGAAERSGHTATLLTDGRVLVAGGDAVDGQAAAAEIWSLDAHGWIARPVSGAGSRTGHTATLLPDGRVMLAGGRDARGRARHDAEAFDPSTGQFSSAEAPRGQTPPFLAESRPRDGAADVELDARLTLRFSTPLALDREDDPNNDETFQLSSGELPVALTIVPAENGRLVFLTPELPLEPETTYRLSIAGAVDETGARLAPVTLAFRTKAAARPPDPDEADDAWEPNARNGWRTDRPDSPWQSLPPLMAGEGVTALSGQVLRLDSRPLADVTLSIEGHEARSDRTGRFLLKLENLAPGRQELLIDGRSASRGARVYGLFEFGLEIAAGQTTVLPFTIWMPRLDLLHTVTIPSPTTTEVVVRTPKIPGLELHVPAGTVIRDHDGKVVRELSITAVPVDRPPFPLARNVEVPVYFTIQPGGAYLHTYGPSKGAWLVYPNYREERPGKKVQFFHYDPEVRGWYVYGLGTVTPNGAQVMPDPKTRLYEFTGAMINSGSSPPADAEPQGDECCNDGDPVNLATGLFELEQTDLYLPDVLPISITRTYRTRDPDIRPFGRGATHPYAMFLWSALQYQEADLILPDGGRIHYVRTSSGTGFVDAVFEHKETATTSATPTGFYKSELRWNGNGWDLRLKDGTVYVFGDSAPLQAIRDRYGNTITIHRTGGQSGNITRVVSPHGRWLEFTYNGSLITQVKDNIGRTVSYIYDAQTRLWKVTDPMNQVTEYTYDADHRMTSVKNRNGVVYVTNEYYTAAPTLGWVKKQTLADGGTYQFAYTVVNGKSTQTDITNPRGFVRRVTLNSDGYILSNTRALGTPEQIVTVSTRPTNTNFVTQIAGPLGQQTSTTHDTKGNPITILRQPGTPEELTTTMTYDSTFYQLASLTDDLNHTTTLARNSNGSLTSITDALNHQTTFTYNTAGRITSMTDALQNSTVFEYQSGDLIRTTNPLNQITTRFVDSVGRVVSVTDPLGLITRYEYDALDRVTKIIGATGGETRLTYSPEGEPLSVTDPNNHVTMFNYDSMRRLIERIDPLQRTATIAYDLNGNLTQHIDRKGQITTKTYDPLDRVKVTTFTGGATVTYNYDAAGRLTEIADSAAGTVTRQYDSLDRLTSEATSQGTVTYAYDSGDRRSGMTVAGQPAIAYTYDAADRVTGITRAGLSVTFGYDDANRRTSLTLPNGVVTEFTYDGAAQLVGLTYKIGTATLGTLTYAYDASGNRIGVGGTFARTLLPQITAAAYDAADQLVQWGTATISHDANGNRTSDGLTSLTWNSRNQLTGVVGATIASFQYDGGGRRVSKTSQGVSTTFLYDGVDVVQELTGSSSAEWLRGMTLDDAYHRSSSAGVGMPLTDALGSTIALLDAGGVIRSEFTYEPFGRSIASGTASDYRFQYSGRENDGTGLYFYRARYYDPSSQRFLSQDPLWTLAGPQSYAYASNNPITWADPLGLHPTDVPGPRHPPQGVRIRCTLADPCALLLVKIAAYDALILGHTAWDALNNQPGRHDREIQEFQNGRNRCWDYFKRKKCDCGPELPQPPPMTEEQMRTQQTILNWLAMLGIAAAAAAYIIFVS